LLAAVLALWLTGQTINLMTLGGLALAIGILVDMSTVVIENIHTHLAQGKRLAQAVTNSGREVAVPLLVAMICVLAVFLPSFFMEGAAKALFVPLSLAVGFSMVASYLLASTFVPVLAMWIMRVHPQEENETVRKTPSAFHRFQNFYAGIARRVISLRWLVTAVYLVGAVLVIKLIGDRLGTEIFPKVDAGQLQVRLRAPSGTRVDRTEALTLRLLDLIKQEAGANAVDLSLGFVGVHAPSYPINLVYQWNGGSEEAVLQVQMKRDAKVGIEALQGRLRERLARELPEVEVSFEPSDIVSRVMSFGSPTPIEIAVSGPNLAADREFAEKIRAKLKQIPSLRDVQFGQSLDYPTVDITVNRERAGLLGVKTIDVSRSLVAATSSSRFTQPVYWADPNSGVAYQIQVQVPQPQMNSTEEVKNIPVAYREGKSVLLRNVARVSEGTSVGQYERYNMQRLVTITANIAGEDLGGAATKVVQAMEAAGAPPPKVNVAVRGQVAPMRQMLDGLQNGLLLAVVVIFLLLAANFQSLRLSFIVISSLPAVIAGVVLMLWLTGTTANLQSFMGAIMAIGVAVANAILLVTFAERSRLGGMAAAQAAADGATSRLRPILMTSLAMMAGMLPMALGLGEGGEQTAPLGRAVIGGLAAATLATLFVLPSVFALVCARATTKSPSLDPDDPLSDHYLPPVQPK
jgi:multidrug efflux pump subunit AcrB